MAPLLTTSTESKLLGAVRVWQSPNADGVEKVVLVRFLGRGLIERLGRLRGDGEPSD